MGASAQQSRAQSPVIELYRELRSVGLDADRVYRVREVAIDRDDLHVYLNDGTIAFARAVDGHVTAAYFEGEGEVLLRPPDAVERSSLGLFTGLGVLNEPFQSAYLRFNDDTAAEIVASGIPAENASEFVASHQDGAKSLASMSALRVLATMTSPPDAFAPVRDRFLHLRIASGRLGNFDVVYDSLANEQIAVGGLNVGGSGANFDVWMAFPGRSVRGMREEERESRLVDPWRSLSAVKIDTVKVDARLLPPETIEATADLGLTVNHGGQRILMFELSRYLQVRSVQLEGSGIDFIQNEALTGSELEKRGNDLITVVLPKPARTDEKLALRFSYSGRVMSQAATGLLYVGERGTWYPNRGLGMAQFELRFHWPESWTLVATGKRTALDKSGDELVGVWRSEGTIPLAGFNLGQYTRTSARAGNIAVESFATSAVEQGLASSGKPVLVRPNPAQWKREPDVAVVMPPDKLNPAEGGQTVADNSARAVERFSQWFGPFPYSTLSITQFPGDSSQGWPTLVFLASASFLSNEERTRLKMSPYQRVLFGELMQAHETAHQWWGDLVGWKTYREQWLSEALANYSALMLLEERHPQDVQLVLQMYSQQLASPNAKGKRYAEAGPVSLGFRLSSSVFPDGYVVVSYGRGTWLLHMLRCVFRDAARNPATGASNGDALFLASLRSLRENFARKELTVADVQRAFEAHMPAAAGFEGQRTLTWFFDGWVNGSAMPHLKLTDVKITSKGAQPAATFTIIQEEAPDDLVTSVPIFATLADDKLVYAGRIFADGHETKARLIVPEGTRKLVLDPKNEVLRTK